MFRQVRGNDNTRIHNNCNICAEWFCVVGAAVHSTKRLQAVPVITKATKASSTAVSPLSNRKG